MLRTLAILLLLTLSVLFLPLPVQLALFILGLFFAPHRLLLFIPAVISDVLYGPSAGFAFGQLLMTYFVAVLLVVHWLMFTQTRIFEAFYGVEKS